MMDRLLLYRALMYGICGYALFKGKTDARIVGAVFLVGNFATLALRSHLASEYSSVESAVFVIDLICFLLFTYAALISDRFWPLWVSGLQLTTSFGHVLKLVDSSLLPLAYAAALRFWGYPILAILAVGVWRSQKRVRCEREAAAT
jgi:hypothetical protein